MARREKPDLPSDTDWPPQTVEWFNAWRDDHITDSWDAVQWQYMFDTAIVHSLVYGSFAFNWLPELRARLVQMGLEFD
jgi:hypothetical protein